MTGGGNRTSEDDLTSASWSASSDVNKNVRCVSYEGDKNWGGTYERKISARPALSPAEAPKIRPENVKTGVNGVKICEYGEYPQTVADERTSERLERLHDSRSLRPTGKNYTFDSVGLTDYDTAFKATSFSEYEMDGKRYIRVPGRPADGDSKLSTGEQVEKGKPYWVEVQPIEWLMDRSGTMVAKKCLFAGIQFDTSSYDGDFSKTSMKHYLDTYFAREMQRNGRAWENTWGTIDWEKDPEDEIIQKITDLYYAGVDFNAKFLGSTPIMYAAMCPSVKVIDLLIDGGADPNLTDEFGSTVLHYASHYGKLENLKYLVERCPKNFVSVKNKKGDTALDLADNPEIAEYLKSCSQNSLQQTLSDASQKLNKMSLIKKTKTR